MVFYLETLSMKDFSRVVKQGKQRGLVFYLKLDTFKLGFNKPGEDLFITNPRIREQITQKNMPVGAMVGWIGLSFIPEAKEIITLDFQPTKDSPALGKKLVGSMAELAIKKMLLPHFPNWKCRDDFYPSIERRAHYRKTDRKVMEAIPIQEEVRRLSEYVRRRMKEDFFRRHPPKAKSETRPKEPVTRMRRFRRK